MGGENMVLDIFRNHIHVCLILKISYSLSFMSHSDIKKWVGCHKGKREKKSEMLEHKGVLWPNVKDKSILDAGFQ